MIFKKKKLLNNNVFFDFLYNFYLKHYSFYEEMSDIQSNMHTGLQVKNPLFLSDIIKLEFS